MEPGGYGPEAVGYGWYHNRGWMTVLEKGADGLME